MGKPTFTDKTDKTQVATQLQGFAALLECPHVRVTYLISAGGLWRVDIGQGSSRFYDEPNEVTQFLVKYATEQQFIRNYKKDS